MAEIRYDHVSLTYRGNDRPAVNQLDLTIGDGEFLVLVGPSGCGKTTALRMLAGLEDVDAGRIAIGGKDVTDLPPKQRNVAMVFQNYALYPHMSVARNMGYALRIAHVPKQEIRRRVEEAAAMLDLSEYLDRKPASLSGGQRQRVAMGRAIVRRPQAFLMDEPLSNLDAKLRVQTRTQIAGLQRRLGTTTLYVTHDQVEAMTMGDRVAVMRDGVLQQVATPHEIYTRPVNTFVAGFVGSPPMNLLTLSRLDPQRLRLGDATIALPPVVAAAAEGEGADALVVGIRPERWRLCAPGEGLAGTVVVVEELGSDTFLHVSARVDGAELPLVVRSDAAPPPAKGSTIALQPVGTDLHFFSALSGERLG